MQLVLGTARETRRVGEDQSSPQLQSGRVPLIAEHKREHKCEQGAGRVQRRSSAPAFHQAAGGGGEVAKAQHLLAHILRIQVRICLLRLARRVDGQLRANRSLSLECQTCFGFQALARLQDCT